MKNSESHLSRILTNPKTLKNPTNFFEVYRVPVHRFFLSLCRDNAMADDLSQDFALKFLSGAFDGYSPEKGRFRDYLKTTLRNQVKKLFRNESKRRQFFRASLLDGESQLKKEEVRAAMSAFDKSEGKEIREIVELDLKAEEADGKHNYYSLLAFMLDFQKSKLEPESIAEKTEQTIKMKVPVLKIAEFLTNHVGQYITEDNAKKQKSRAVARYAEKMITEISNRIGTTEHEQVWQAAEELGLLAFCGKELLKRK